MSKRGVIAVSLAGVYLVASAWALWDRLDAVLLFAVASPVAASFIFPKDTNMATRLLIGTLIDAFLGALAFVPILGDLIDLGASAVAVVLIVVRFRQFASSVPGGLACLALYVFLWLEAGFLPHQLSVADVHHGIWFYLVAVISSALAGGLILAALVMLLGLMYDGDRAKATFCTVGFPWYLITFLLTVFLPNNHVKQAHETTDLARRRV